MQKLKTALYGAAMAGCALATAASASPQNIGTMFVTGTPQATKQVHFDVFLPLRNKNKLEALLEAQQNPSSAQYHKWLTPAQFGAQFGPDRATITRVANALRARGFAVKPQTRSVHVTGTVDLVNRTFGVHLVTARSMPGTSHIVTEDRFSMPKELAAAGAQIPSFAPMAMQPFVQPVGKVYDKPAAKAGLPPNRYSDTGPYWFTDHRQAYEYPSYNATVTVNGTTKPLNGKGAIIGALMASDVLDSDIQDMFDHEHWTDITGQPAPKLAARFNLNGGGGFDPNSGISLEASLDVQQEITGAPGAAVVLYNIPSLAQTDVIGAYVEVDEDNLVDVLSSSFGLCERYFFPRYEGGQDFRFIPLVEHELFMQGNAQGISFLASSGDNAGKECASIKYFEGHPSHYVPGVSSPAADPNVTAVGGTNLVTSFNGTLKSKYVTENAWDDPEVAQDPYGVGVPLRGGVWGAGGGYSRMFPAPSYQLNVATGSNMRALPDIGMEVGGCPGSAITTKKGVCRGGNDPRNGSGNTQRSSSIVALDHVDRGFYFAVIGTSVSSPQMAAVIAHLVEQHGRMGNVNNYIYRLAAKQASTGHRFYHTNIPGFNGVEETDLNSSYSLSVGVGTPIMKNFIGQHSVERAGNPQTPSNP